MGGRKSYKTSNLIGGSKPVKKAVSNLKDFLEKDNINKVGESAFRVYSEAKKPLQYTAYAEKLTPTLIRRYSELKSEKNDHKLRREISKSWSTVKESNKISVPKEVDRVVVENALKFLRGGSRG
ncbi:hypothetical protein KY346_00075 [Candidatus Woesearchaeota archaeon]|nr:hypothetical protein [Candidatus Woesearchaeota archaeon]